MSGRRHAITANGATTTLGFVGLGSFATELAEACRRVPGIRIGACYDELPDRRSRFARRYGCRQAAEFQLLANDPELDGVVVASPNHVHVEHGVALAHAGKHVFIEKPLGTDLTQVDRIIDACHDRGRLLAVGHQERRRSAYRHIKRLIDDGELGRIYSFEANHCGDLLRAWPADDWRFGEHGVGPLLHKGIHKIDVLTYCFGPASSVTATATSLAANPAMHETCVCVVGYDSGIVGSLTAGFRYNNASFNLYGERRSVRYDGGGNRIRIKNERTWEETTVDCGPDDPLAEELAEFAAAIHGRSAIEVDGHVAREAILFAATADEAARQGVTLALADRREPTPLTTTT